MRYQDVVQYDPIESVIQLRLADQADEAARLMRTNQISNEMAERLDTVVFQQLQFDEPADQKGLLVVGNYGTGKSHLMSVISLLAQDAAYLDTVQHPKVAKSAKRIAGRFKVHRIEISSQMATIELMPSSQLTDFQDKLGNLRSCYQLTESELNGIPVCPHCQFKPVNETLGLPSAANQLSELDTKLDDLVSGWTDVLISNLEDPTIQANLELLKEAESKQIHAFLAAKTLPDPLSGEFITAAQTALSSLTKEIVKVADIQGALLSGGSPATPEELKARFDKFIAERTRGKDANKLRFVVE
jgi:hypothetical protein